MRALLDINVLLALFDRDHIDHARARGWLTDNISDGWASCPITENGFVRIISQPRYPSPITTSEALGLLRQACTTPHHKLLPCDISLLDLSHVKGAHIHGPKQVTDVYLLALAVRHKAHFVTFDSAVPLSAVPAATPDHLVVI